MHIPRETATECLWPEKQSHPESTLPRETATHSHIYSYTQSIYTQGNSYAQSTLPRETATHSTALTQPHIITRTEYIYPGKQLYTEYTYPEEQPHGEHAYTQGYGQRACTDPGKQSHTERTASRCPGNRLAFPPERKGASPDSLTE